MRSDVRELDESVAIAGSRKDDWVRLPVPRRIDLLRQCLDAYLGTAADVVAASCEAKQTTASGEEWMSGPIPVIRQLRLFTETLTSIHRTGNPTLSAASIHRTPTGELAVRVFPRDVFERVMYPGTRIDVWMQPDVDERNVRDTMAVAYRRERATDGKVALVLGAGNVASIAPTDVLYKLLVENQVVVLKMHPVNDYLGPLLRRGFRPLIDAGYLRVVHGDAQEGQHLIHHPGVDEIHMTGSTAVHDRIVWGDTPEEQARRRAALAPKVTKRMTSELGCVTPIVVVPGRWAEAELQYQAEHVATMVLHSASCTCTTARLLVTRREWPQRQAFLDRVAAVLSNQPPRVGYYPGSAAKYHRFTARHPQTRFLCDVRRGNGDVKSGTLTDFAAALSENGECPRFHVPVSPAVIYDVDASLAGDLVFTDEAWSPVLAETAIAAGSDAEFVDAAVRFCNERVFGTLGISLLASPESQARLRDEMHRAVAALRYGTIAVNHWTATNFALGTAPWGAYPGHTLDDVGSGIGVVHNTLMFDRPLKTVVWGPFTSSPKPAWFVTHRRGNIAGRRMAPFEASPSLWRLPGIAWPALRP